MDRRQVEYCVGLGFEKLVEGLPDDELQYEHELVYDSEGRIAKPAKQRAFARHYLEKLVNIEVPVPELSEEVLEAMLVPPEPKPSEARGEDGMRWWRRLAALMWRRGEAPAGDAEGQGDARFGQGDDAEGHVAARTPSTEWPRWLDQLKTGLQTSAQVARVGVLAFVLGWLVVWGIEKLRELPERKVEPAQELSLPSSAARPPASEELPSVRVEGPETAPSGPQLLDDLARVPLPETPLVDEIPSGRRWAWWSPATLVLLLAAFWGVGALMRRERQVVEDSPHFRRALAAVRPLLEEANPTPRAIKRYQNRMRYLAERLRPQNYEPDAIDSFLHWLGGRIGRSIVPDIWFADSQRTAISEPALILLGAVETCAPQAFEQPTEQVLDWLDRKTDGDRRAQRRAQAWRKVKKDFGGRFPPNRYGHAWPSVNDVRVYQTFVQGGGGGIVASKPPVPGGSPPRARPQIVTQNPQ